MSTARLRIDPGFLWMALMARERGSALYADMSKEWVECPICDGTQFDVLSRTDRYRMGIQTCECQRCGLAMTNPMPNEASLDGFYRENYRAFYRKVENPSPELIQRYGITRRAEYTAAFLRDAGLLQPNTRILDFGCAEGSLLKAIQAVAPTVRCNGIEPNPQYAEFARKGTGAQVWPSLDDVPQGGQFDLVLVNHVLEHVRMPTALLERIKGLLSDSSVIYVDVPDAARYCSVDDLHIAHLYHFTGTSLSRVGARAGLDTRTMIHHDPPGHPFSVRGLFVRGTPTAQGNTRDPEADAVKQAIELITRRASLYFARRSLIGRVVIGGPARIWRALVS